MTLELGITTVHGVNNAQECLEQEMEGCYPCTQAAMDSWKELQEKEEEEKVTLFLFRAESAGLIQFVFLK